MSPDRSETDSEGHTQYFYTLSTIRKWLEEEISADVFQAGVNCPGSFEDTYRAMLSQKLAELEQP